MLHRSTARMSNRSIRHVIGREMAREGLSYTDIARRRGCDLRTVTEFFRDIGTRHHRIQTLSEFSRALRKPGDLLRNLLPDNGFRWIRWLTRIC